MNAMPKPLGGKWLTWPVMFFLPFVMLCAIVIVKRLAFGIGDVANLNGGYPWGLWISFDLLVGTGFACGGWALAWAVYVVNKGEYHPLIRPALLASLFGYTLGGLSITLDMGRWWNLPYFFIPGYASTSSVLFETALCMTVYIGVMIIEFAPTVLEKLGWKLSVQRVNKIMFGVIALGALLPTMHQSSMGSLFIAAGEKIHPLWQSYELLPLFSLLTALIMGFSIVVFEGSLLQASLKGKLNEVPLFYRLSQIVDIFLISFVVLRFGEIVITNKVSYLVTWDKASLWFWAEMLFMTFPLLVFHWDRLRHDARLLFAGALSMLIGAALWRVNLSVLAFSPGDGYHYFPSAQEILLSLGLVAVEVTGYLILIRMLPILPSLERMQDSYKADAAAQPAEAHGR